MFEKEKDPEAIKQNISHKPIDYEKLNKLYDDFGKSFTPQQELSTDQAFWLRMSNPTSKPFDASHVKIKDPKELPKVSLVNEILKKLKLHLARFDNVVKIMTTPNAHTEAQIQDKDNTICKLKDMIKSMREKSKEENLKYDYGEIETKNVELENRKEIVDIAAQIPSGNTIVPGMFKLDSEPLAPRLLQNREARIDYLKYTQEQAGILWKIVKQAKAKQPLDKELDFAYKHAQGIQELLVYVQDTCPNAINLSAKKVVVTPKNKVKKVRFAKPLTSSSNIKQVESSTTSDSNTPVLSPTRLKCSTINYGSKPTDNKRNDRISRAKSAKKHKNQNIWKPTGHVFTEVGLKWKQQAELSLCWFSGLYSGTVRFENDQIARIMGYGDYQLGNIIILRVYYVEGLGHNLFSVGQFCDADLEVAFQKNTCFIPNLEGVDLLSRSRDTNLYTISLDNMLKSSPICLLSKVSKTMSWLWHRCLSHLNFACALGKSKKSSHQPKAEDTNQEKLYLLHMDLCGPVRVASINGKRYILVIVDDYSRFTWVKFLKTKDEALAAIIKCIKNIQVRLNATVRNVQIDNETEFVNQTLREWYENVGITHQTSVARTPQQNNVVKRQNRTLVEAARTMLIFSKAPLFL
ncbi:retrovirus-related pol polyprotein from transposon TNT 1-94 [Tanacetum coccineum]